HRQVGELLDALKRGAGKSRLARTVARRLERRKGLLGDLRERRRKDEAGKALAFIENGSLPLLAEAAAGRCDRRALGWLDAAWRNDDAVKTAGEGVPLGMLRSAWVLSEASLALGREGQLKAVSGRAMSAADKSAERVLDALGKEPSAELRAAAVYAVLALRNGRKLGLVEADRYERTRARLLKLVPAEGEGADVLGIAARGLLEEKVDGERGKKLLAGAEGLAGNDQALLAALAARRIGGETWLAFREAARESFKAKGISGSVVLLTNRLGKTPLPSAAR
ncbi:MAG: hypothetical protein ACYTGB_09985, partial [Planctomycetota bacterium]